MVFLISLIWFGLNITHITLCFILLLPVKLYQPPFFISISHCISGTGHLGNLRSTVLFSRNRTILSKHLFNELPMGETASHYTSMNHWATLQPWYLISLLFEPVFSNPICVRIIYKGFLPHILPLGCWWIFKLKGAFINLGCFFYSDGFLP